MYRILDNILMYFLVNAAPPKIHCRLQVYRSHDVEGTG